MDPGGPRAAQDQRYSNTKAIQDDGKSASALAEREWSWVGGGWHREARDDGERALCVRTVVDMATALMGGCQGGDGERASGVRTVVPMATALFRGVQGGGNWRPGI